MSATQDNFEFNLVGPANKPFDGYVSTDDPTNTAPNVLVRGSQNVYKNLSQQVVNRCGLKRRGTGDPTEDGVVATYEWYDSLGRTIPVRVLASGKWQFESDIVTPGTFVWYDLLTTANHTRFIFNPWWDDVQQKDLLTGVNGSSNIYAWAGGIASVASTGTVTNGITATGIFVSGGSGITVGSTFAVEGNGGSGAVIEVLEVDGSGSITSARLVTPGTGYIVATGYTLTRLTGSGGAGLDGIGSYTLVGGDGISAGTVLGVTSGNGDAEITVTSVDAITGIPLADELTNPGSGYTVSAGNATTVVSGSVSGSLPTVTILSLGDVFTAEVTEVQDYGTITKNGTETWAEAGFLQSGSVVASGTTYSYFAGTDTTTLYVTGDTSGLAVDSAVYSSVITTANTPATGFSNDLSIVFNNQLIIGSYSSRLVYASSNTDYTDFTEVSPFFEGLPFILTLDDTVKGFAIRQGNLQISAGLSDWYEIILSTTNISGTTYANIAVNKKPGATLSAALGQEFISNNGDDIYYVAQDHQLYVYGAFTNQFSQRFPALSQAIRDELKDEDFTGGALRWVNDSLYLSSITSGKTYTYSARQFVDPNGNIVAERLWYPPQIWNISRICVIDGVIYGASSENPQYYQLFDTGQFHDDTPTSTVAPYECVARWAYWNSGKRTKLVDLDKIYIEGYLATNSPLTLRLRDDYLASTAYQEAVVSALDDNPTLFTDSGVIPIGAGVGSHTIGGEGLDEFGNPQLPKFRAIMTFERHNVFEYQFELYSYDADSQWAILAIGTNASQVVNNPVFIQKS